MQAEILVPPLSGLEVIGWKEEADGLLAYSMALNCNLQVGSALTHYLAAR